jgi:hypothetical protein
MSVLLIFVDGVGIGRRDPAVNPFAALEGTLLGRFEDELPDSRPITLGGGALCRSIDATLGVEGLPQSATGQATLLTGVNVPAAIGRHLSGVPGPRVRSIIEKNSLFLALRSSGMRSTFANAYRPRFFTDSRKRLSASTLSVLAAGLRLRTLDDLIAGQAVFHDYTLGVLERHTGIRLPERSAAEAAATLAGLAGEHEFVLHEHFLTDLAGHRGSKEDRLAAAARIEALVAECLKAVEGSGTLLLIVSDHGNLEDSTHHRHTRAPVPLIASGPGAGEIISEVNRLDELAPAILRRLGAGSTSSKA